MMARNRHIDDPHALLFAILRGDFRAFLRKAFPAVSGEAAIKWNWHLDAIAHELNRVANRDNRHLLVTMPPRNLKSITISVAWVAWMLGRDPSLNFVCVSYSNDLSAKLARFCLTLMQAGWYRELFPATIVSANRTATSDFETTAGGGRLATSITGTLTGRGGDIIIIDDPIKPEEAHSETSRNNVNHWFQSTLASRLNDKGTGAIVVVMQRLHQYDLAGMLIEQGGWHELSLPAIATEAALIPLCGGHVKVRSIDDVLHPERESRAILEGQRFMMGSIDFDAQYQQQPVPADGNLIKAEWLVTYEAGFDPASHGGHIVQSWDTASKDGVLNDWSVCITALENRGRVWILDVYRAKLTFPDLKQKVIALAQQYGTKTLLIEDAASGLQLLQTLWAEEPLGVPRPIARRPEADKFSRMAGVSGQIAGGQLLLPSDAPWLAGFKAELLGFPFARHDDQADALTQLMSWTLRFRGSTLGSCSLPVFFVSHDGISTKIVGDYNGIFSAKTPTNRNHDK